MAAVFSKPSRSVACARLDRYRPLKLPIPCEMLRRNPPGEHHEPSLRAHRSDPRPHRIDAHRPCRWNLEGDREPATCGGPKRSPPSPCRPAARPLLCAGKAFPLAVTLALRVPFERTASASPPRADAITTLDISTSSAAGRCTTATNDSSQRQSQFFPHDLAPVTGPSVSAARWPRNRSLDLSAFKGERAGTATKAGGRAARAIQIGVAAERARDLGVTRHRY